MMPTEPAAPLARRGRKSVARIVAGDAAALAKRAWRWFSVVDLVLPALIAGTLYMATCATTDGAVACTAILGTTVIAAFGMPYALARQDLIDMLRDFIDLRAASVRRYIDSVNSRARGEQ